MTTKSMKGFKRIATGIILASTPMLSFGASYGPSGCGLGAIVFDGQAGLVPNVLAATTNGIFGNATFGMTFGTLGCDVSVEVKSNAALFIDGNLESIASDMDRLLLIQELHNDHDVDGQRKHSSTASTIRPGQEEGMDQNDCIRVCNLRRPRARTKSRWKKL